MKLQWWCEVPQVSVVETVVTLPSFVLKYQCFRRMCCFYLQSVRVKSWYIKRGERTGRQWQTMAAVYTSLLMQISTSLLSLVIA
jgi:hypothetical protein